MTRIKNIAVPDDLVFFLSIVNTITGALPACAVPMMHFSNNTAGATGWLRDEKRAELVWYDYDGGTLCITFYEANSVLR